MPLSLAFSSHCRFCLNDYIAIMYAKIACNIFFLSLWCLFASNTAVFKILTFFLAHKVSLNTSLKLRKTLKKLQSLAYTEMNQTKLVSEYDQEIPQLQTADNPVAQRGRATQPSRDTRKTN